MSWGDLARRFQEGSLYVLLFLLPFSKAAIEICSVLLVVGWIAERLDPATRTQTVWTARSLRPLALAVGIYLAICAASIAVSDVPASSLRGFIGKWLEYLLFFVIVTDIASRPKVVIRSLTVLAWSVLCVVLQGMVQATVVWLSQRTFIGLFRGRPFFSTYHRMTGPYENPIDLGTYLMVLIPIMLGFSLSQRSLKRVAVSVLVLAIAGCLAQTGSRGAWLGLWMGLLAIMVSNASIRRYGILLLIGSVLLGGVALQQTGRLKALASPTEIGKADRWVMWQAAMGMIYDRPILGHGLNTFMANYLNYWVGGERQPRYAHNCYLQVAAETGLAGLVGFLWLLWLMFRRWFAAVPRAARPEQMLLLGLIGGLLAFALQAGVDTNFYSLRQAALFWVLGGLATGLSVRLRCDVPTLPP